MGMPLTITLDYIKKDGTTVRAASGLNSAPVNENYRYIKFAKPTSDECRAWLEANAVRLPLIGTYVFNSKSSESATKGKTITGNVEFVSNNISYTSMTINYGSSYGTNGYSISDISYGATQVNTVDAWTNQAYRTITFTQPVYYQGNEEFVK